MVSKEIIDKLDPGIRELVVELHGQGFHTCDSGDGVTKYKDNPGYEGGLKERHVFIQCESPEQAIRETDKLKNLYPNACVEMSYAPPQGANIMILPDGINIDESQYGVDKKN